MLDLTDAVRTAPDLFIELRVNGGNVELVLAPGMVVDANELKPTGFGDVRDVPRFWWCWVAGILVLLITRRGSGCPVVIPPSSATGCWSW
ncbi:hypothetical protein ACFOY4_38855 [Actinomadura syzygii]|uniref:hypothetical protein n=1 Tax=Actinomadura syzygii TaxID=1427538 RepID=UPI001CA3358E|nr:hypothetical protein [Actinomadura syzygii]